MKTCADCIYYGVCLDVGEDDTPKTLCEDFPFDCDC